MRLKRTFGCVGRSHGAYLATLPSQPCVLKRVAAGKMERQPSSANAFPFAISVLPFGHVFFTSRLRSIQKTIGISDLSRGDPKGLRTYVAGTKGPLTPSIDGPQMFHVQAFPVFSNMFVIIVLKSFDTKGLWLTVGSFSC